MDTRDYTELEFDKGKRYIITRVVSYSSQNDHVELFNFYGWNMIKEEVVYIKYLKFQNESLFKDFHLVCGTT
jgi:hypothetical protein